MYANKKSKAHHQLPVRKNNTSILINFVDNPLGKTTERYF